MIYSEQPWSRGSLFRLTATSLLLEYTLSSAAIARAFTSYAGSLLSLDAGLLRIPLSPPAPIPAPSAPLQLDLPALAAVAALAALLAAGTHGSSAFNTAATAANLAVILFVFASGLPHFTPAHFSPFMPLGLRGTISGSSKVAPPRLSPSTHLPDALC